MRVLARLPYDTIFATVYAGLKINLCLVVAGLPLLVPLAFASTPLAAWPFFTLLSAICAPAVSAAFTTFERFTDGEHRVGRAFWSAYRSGFGRSLAIGAVAGAAVVVLAADFQLALGGPFAAVTPMLALVIALIVAVTPAILATERRPAARLWVQCAYLVIRTWYLSGASVMVLGVLAAAVVAKPAIGLFLLPAPALYVVWANTRAVLEPLRRSPA